MKKIFFFSAFLFCVYSSLFASQLLVEPKEKSVSEELPQGAAPSRFFQLRSIVFESNHSRIQIKIEGTGNFSKVHEEKFFNPGRLVLEIPQIENAINLN